VLVAGDQSVRQEAHELLGEEVVTVQVKESRAHFAAEAVHPNVARRMLREAASRAIRERARVRPLQVATPVDIEVTLARPVYADLVAMVDNVERVDGRTLRFTRADMPNAYRILRLITVLCSTPV
jgi:D-amino peptidase